MWRVVQTTLYSLLSTIGVTDVSYWKDAHYHAEGSEGRL
jgi:hypothetical protein